MKKRKRILSSVLAMLLMFSAVVVPAAAEEVEVEPQADVYSDLGGWQSNKIGAAISDSNTITAVSEDEVIFNSVGTAGKLAKDEESILFLAKELSAQSSFTLRAKAYVNSFRANGVSSDNQISFGLMIRDSVLGNSQKIASYVAVGNINRRDQGVYKNIDSTINKEWNLDSNVTSNNSPVAGNTYDLSITKSGNVYKTTINGVTRVITEPLFNHDQNIYVGMYVARDAVVTFSDFELELFTPEHSGQLSVDVTKSEYLVGDSIDHSTLTVTSSTYGVLTADQYFLSGYDSKVIGEQLVSVYFQAADPVLFFVNVIKLTLEEMVVKYYPAQLEYYIGDMFDPTGMVVQGRYNNGTAPDLDKGQYKIDITGTNDAGAFVEPGTQTVTVMSAENSDVFISFDVEVKSTMLNGLIIGKNPARTSYFLGEALNLDGMILYAEYADGTKVRLADGEYTYEVQGMPASTNGIITLTEVGEHDVVFHFRGVQTKFAISVKEKSFTGLVVTAYPQTTYMIGEELNLVGLTVEKAYDNGDLEALSDGGYSVDQSAYDNTKTGIYDLLIQAIDTMIAPIALKVTVRDLGQNEWDSIIFGQSVGKERNKVTINEDGSIELYAHESGGKVTGDHDGISFYYTELNALEDNFTLSAMIEVKNFAKEPSHDGQESFGIMARDVIGKPYDSSIFSSNIAAVGGYSGGTTATVGTQLFARTGVESSTDGAKSFKKEMLESVRPSASNTPYKLTLRKSNTGFHASINDGLEKLIYEPEILSVQNDKMYVGFFVARHATIVVRDIQLEVTASATDAPKVEAPPTQVTPTFDFVSLNQISEENYDIRVTSNVNGTVTIRQGQHQLVLDAPVQAGVQTIVNTTLQQGNNSFSAVFIPDDTQVLTSYDRIIKNFAVTMQSYEGDTIYVSPVGTSANQGTEQSPLDLDTAVAYVKPGQTIMMLDGTYKRTSKLEIKKYNDGKAGAMKSLIAAPGTRPVIDFDKKSEGVILGASYWHVKGIDFTRSAGNLKGFTVGGSYNIVENSRFYENGDTGLQISRTDGSDDRKDWPAHNLILNSTSFDNRDPSDNNADGFAAKLTVGEGNIFRGCIAHNNIDDGWDLYTKAGTGAIGAVLIEDSIAYDNGFLTNGTSGAGDKNGFKLGGEGIHVPHIIRNSVAFGNGAFGFASNSNPGVIVEGGVSFNNEGANLNLVTYSGIKEDFKMSGFVSYQNKEYPRDRYPAELASNDNYLFDGKKSANKSGVVLTDDNFKSLTPVKEYDRDEDGNIIWGDFLKFIKPSTPSTPSGGGTSSTPSTSSTTPKPADKVDNTNAVTNETVLIGKSGVVLTKESVPYISGYADGTVRPNNDISREEVLSLLYKLAVNEEKGKASTSAAVFKDVKADSWSAEAIAFFQDKGLVGGYADGTFKPQASITRAEFVTILANFLSDETGTAGSFKDTDGHWASKSIGLAAAAGWVNGYGDGSFRPERSLTRAEAVVIMNRALGRTIDEEASKAKAGFTDLDPSHWAYHHMMASSH